MPTAEPPLPAIRFMVSSCSLGSVAIAASASGIVAASLADDTDSARRELLEAFPAATPADDATLADWANRLIASIDDPATGLDVPLGPSGSPFRRQVWAELRKIPAGTTITYTELARRCGCPDAVRAVASACAANPIAVAIPCHRVVRSDGSLSGYRWGLARKRALIAREAGSESYLPGLSF